MTNTILHLTHISTEMCILVCTGVHLSYYLHVSECTCICLSFHIQQVVNGPTIPISVQGCGVEPKLVFSPAEIDFGMRFIHLPEMSPRVATVVMANNDKEDIR